jgi:ATP-dependent DNA helicase PIF1
MMKFIEKRIDKHIEFVDKHMEFTEEQNYAFQQYVNKENIFVTGPGGSGKSMFIKKVVEHANENGIKLDVCALTGCAAILLECGAKTLHSWGGLGLANGDINTIAKSIVDNKYKRIPWLKVKVLVIDEISMLSYKLFELIELIARKTRKTEKIFGGIQVIFCGDFFQLPPVGNSGEPLSEKFCFECPLFDEMFLNHNKIQFTKIFRQTDPIYSEILNSIRVNKLSQKHIDILHTCVEKKYDIIDNIRPTIIHPLKFPVERINNNSLKLLEGEEHIFTRKQERLSDTELTAKQLEKCKHVTEKQIEFEFLTLEKNINCNKTMRLKVGAQVMCIINKDFHNTPNPICNGSQGIVQSFHKETGNPIVKFNNGVIKEIHNHSWISDKIPNVCIKQIPLILAWAVTIHKVQGSTIDVAEIDIGSDVFECGQSYVALSRVTDLKGLYLKSFDPSRIKVNLKVQQFYETISSISKEEKLEEEKVLSIF